MADQEELEKIRKLKKQQRNGEEDPVIVAQRFLNIFRQLHIFSGERKEAFNKMVMELSPDIRSMFSSLPGGGVLQDYVDELEAKEGVTRESTSSSLAPDMADEEVSKAKILATALAEAQIQASAKMQQMAPQSAPISPSAQAPISNISSKIELSGNFAQDLGNALSAALKNNNETQKEDIKNIIQTLGQTQLEIVKVLQIENEERKAEAQNLTKMFIESQNQLANTLKQPRESVSAPAMTTTATPQGQNEDNAKILRVLAGTQSQMAAVLNELKNKESAPVQNTAHTVISEDNSQLIKMLTASQQQIAKMLYAVETNNKNNSEQIIKLFEHSQQQFISAVKAVNENHKSDSVEISKAMAQSQQEIAKLLVQNNTINNVAPAAAAANNNANNIQINTADYSSQLTQIADKLERVQSVNVEAMETMLSHLVKAQSELYQKVAETQTKELSAIITVALKESQKISTQNIIQAIEKLPKASQVVEKIVTIPQEVRYVHVNNEQAASAPIPVPETAIEEKPQSFREQKFDSSFEELVEEPMNKNSFHENDYVPRAISEEHISDDTQIFNENPTADSVLSENTSSGELLGTPKKKKKKKKKKNKNVSEILEGTDNLTTNAEFMPADLNSSEEKPSNEFPPSEQDEVTADEYPLTMQVEIPENENSLIEQSEPEDIFPDIPLINENIDASFDDDEFSVSNDEAMSSVYEPTIFNEVAETEMSGGDDENTSLSAEEDDEANFGLDEDSSDFSLEKKSSLLEPSANDWGFSSDYEAPVDLDSSPVSNSWSWDKDIEETDSSSLEYPTASEELTAEDLQTDIDSTEGEDWVWEYEAVDGTETASNGFSEDAEGEDWVWEYEEVDGGNQVFDAENLKPISSNNPIYSGDLYFHNSVYRNETENAIETAIPLEGTTIMIKDSRNSENKDDPYQNIDSKH